MYLRTKSTYYTAIRFKDKCTAVVEVFRIAVTQQ